MKQDIAKKWVKALRSGKYKQTKEVLFNGTGYCCLGVLCEVVGMSPTRDLRGFHYDNMGLLLPEAAMQLSGIKTDGADLIIAGRYTTLANQNDHGKSFKQIANFIEKHWKDL